MNKKYGYIWPTVLALVLAIGIFIGGKLHFDDTPEKLFSTNSKKDKLNRLIDYIDYVRLVKMIFTLRISKSSSPFMDKIWNGQF